MSIMPVIIPAIVRAFEKHVFLLLSFTLSRPLVQALAPVCLARVTTLETGSEGRKSIVKFRFGDNNTQACLSYL